MCSLSTRIITARQIQSDERAGFRNDHDRQKARDLLTDRPWTLRGSVRLTAGIDHLLVRTSAKDTSPGQWAVVQHLTRREFVQRRGVREIYAAHCVVSEVTTEASIYSSSGCREPGWKCYRDSATTSTPRWRRSMPATGPRTAGAFVPIPLPRFLRVVDGRMLARTVRRLGSVAAHRVQRGTCPGRGRDLWPRHQPRKASRPD